MKHGKTENGSYVHNCLLILRKGSKVKRLFDLNDPIIVRLNGYAIIPMEEYIKLKPNETFSDDFMQKIRDAEEDLNE